MFGIGFQEMLIILVVILIIFGPKRLPDLAKSLGKGIAEFKKASEEVRKGIEEAVQEEEKPTVPPGEGTAAVPGTAPAAAHESVAAPAPETAPAAPGIAHASGDPEAGHAEARGPEAEPPRGA